MCKLNAQICAHFEPGLQETSEIKNQEVDCFTSWLGYRSAYPTGYQTLEENFKSKQRVIQPALKTF